MLLRVFGQGVYRFWDHLFMKNSTHQRDELVGINAIFFRKPTLDRNQKRVDVKISRKLGRRCDVQRRHSCFDDRLEAFTKMRRERVLPLYFKRAAIERTVIVEITTKLNEALIAWFGTQTEFGIKYPVHQIIFVFEMVIKAFAVHKTTVADLANTYLLEGFILKKLLQRGSKRFFCYC